jgi:hypothetical protein
LSKLKTLKEPHESMPRLADLLEYLAQPGMEEIWVMLDIKVRVTVCWGGSEREKEKRELN